MSLQKIEKLKTKIFQISKKIESMGEARILMTKKLKSHWKSELNKSKGHDNFKIDYSKPSNELFGKIFDKIDIKSSIKSNVSFNKYLVANYKRRN